MRTIENLESKEMDIRNIAIMDMNWRKNRITLLYIYMELKFINLKVKPNILKTYAQNSRTKLCILMP
jgi:hypothetical protein